MRTELGDLESQEEDSPKLVVWYKRMAWFGMFRSHHREEDWSVSLFQTFFVMTVGVEIPPIPPSTCGCKEFQLDALGDHMSTCTIHPGVKKTHDWAVDQLAVLFRTTHKVKTQQVSDSRGQRRGDIERADAGPVSLVLDLCITHKSWQVALTLVLMGNCTTHHLLT